MESESFQNVYSFVNESMTSSNFSDQTFVGEGDDFNFNSRVDLPETTQMQVDNIQKAVNSEEGFLKEVKNLEDVSKDFKRNFESSILNML